MMLGHQGGWDEALLVVIPLIVLAALLLYAFLRRYPDDGHSAATDADEPRRDRTP